MKHFLNIPKIKFYLWVASGYCLLGIVSTIGSNPGKLIPVVFNNVWAVIYVSVFNFILFEYIVSFVLKKRKAIGSGIFLGLFFLFILGILYSYGSYLWRLIGITLHTYTDLKRFASLNRLLQNQLVYSVGSVCFFGGIRHIYNYINLRQGTQQLRIDKQAAELNFLRSQTNPHFLFNTLNNIYALSRDKSDLAPESILRLSQILRFMLYETSGDYIAIEQEIKIITDYIDLEKLRYDNSLRVNFNRDIEDREQALPPLLLIPLVENAFKHGVSETADNPFVDIQLTVNNSRLTLLIKNSAELVAGEKAVKENIGLSNLRRQLELLYTDYELSVQQDEKIFTAILKINLASHAGNKMYNN